MLLQDAGLTPTNEQQLAINNMIAQATEVGVSWGMKVLTALVILIVGMFIAGRLKSAVRKLLSKQSRIDATLSGFLGSLVYYAVIALVIIAVIGNFGVPTASFAAVLGAAGLAIGLALQGTLGHIASGVMLLAFRPFNVGDYVIAGGQEGTIKDMNLFTTELATVDNKKIIIPNGMVWDDVITNFSANSTRRLDLVFGISYNDDINKAMAVIKSVIDTDERVHDNPEPIIKVNNLGDYSVDFTVRLWLDGANYFPVKWDMLKNVKEAFDREGVTIPFPTSIELQGDFGTAAAEDARTDA